MELERSGCETMDGVEDVAAFASLYLIIVGANYNWEKNPFRRPTVKASTRSQNKLDYYFYYLLLFILEFI